MDFDKVLQLEGTHALSPPLRVAQALPGDIEQGMVRVSFQIIQQMQCQVGDIVLIRGERHSLARIAAFPEFSTLPFEHVHQPDSPVPTIQMDGLVRENTQCNLDDWVQFLRCNPPAIQQLSIAPLQRVTLTEHDYTRIQQAICGRVFMPGDKFLLPLFDRHSTAFSVVGLEPSPQGGYCTEATKLVLESPMRVTSHGLDPIKYEQIGGLDIEIKRIREMIELPMKHQRLFSQMRITPPKGLLLYGPPGTGKTTIARAVANEVKAHFIRINGPEIIHKFYGESEAKLRELFDEALRKAPSILFIDEIDAIAPKRADVAGEVEKRVVGQLLALMDGMASRGQVVVIGATNLPELIDHALRRPGRFDREIAIQPPHRLGRLHILHIHSHGMPLASDVDLDSLADITHGFVGADLEGLCKEAGMIAMQRVLAKTPIYREDDDATVPNGLLAQAHAPINEQLSHAHHILHTTTAHNAHNASNNTLGNEIGSGNETLHQIQISQSVQGEQGTLAKNHVLSAAADEKVQMTDFIDALKMIQPTAARESLAERPNACWGDIGGLDDVKSTLLTAVDLPRRHPKLYQRTGVIPPRGLLIKGASGTGKTLLVRALAAETGFSYIAVDATMLFFKWIGESEKALRQVFLKARQTAPCIIFFDDIDTIFSAHDHDQGSSGSRERLLGQFFSELDSLHPSEAVVVIAASSHPNLLEPSLLSPERFGVQVTLTLPNRQAREEILAIHTNNIALDGDVSLPSLAQMSEGFSGAALASWCRQAALDSLQRLVEEKGYVVAEQESDQFCVNHQSFLQVIKNWDKNTDLPRASILPSQSKFTHSDA